MITNRIKTVNLCFFMTVILALFRGEILFFASKVINSELFLTVLSQIVLILPAVYYLFKTKTNAIEAFRVRKISWKQLFLIVLFAVVLMPVLSLVNAITMLFAQNHVQNTITSITQQYPFWVNLCSMAIIPALLEETVYRGLFYREYQKESVGKGIILSAFLFGCMHMNFNQFAYAFVMGIIFCMLVEATDSILSSIFMHFMINGSSLFVAELSQKQELLLGTQETTVIQTREIMFQTIPYLIIPALIGGILAIILFKKICRISGREYSVRKLIHRDDGSKLITPSLLGGIIICIVIMIGNQ